MRVARVCVTGLGLLGSIGGLNLACPVRAATIVTKPTLESDAKPDSFEALQFCIESSGSDEKLSSCIGSTVDYCVEHIDDAGGTDLNYSRCNTRETAFWDRLLNERYRTLMTQFTDNDKKQGQLKAAQEGWLKLRENFCEIIADMPGSTSYVSNMFSDCELRMTARQVINLKDLSEELRR